MIHDAAKHDTPRVTFEFRLPCCGIQFTNALRHDGPLKDFEHVYAFLGNAQHVLGHWAKTRMDDHRCELVTEENPMGLLKKAPKTEPA